MQNVFSLLQVELIPAQFEKSPSLSLTLLAIGGLVGSKAASGTAAGATAAGVATVGKAASTVGAGKAAAASAAG